MVDDSRLLYGKRCPEVYSKLAGMIQTAETQRRREEIIRGTEGIKQDRVPDCFVRIPAFLGVSASRR
jgi:hypothetical protein